MQRCRGAEVQRCRGAEVQRSGGAAVRPFGPSALRQAQDRLRSGLRTGFAHRPRCRGAAVRLRSPTEVQRSSGSALRPFGFAVVEPVETQGSGQASLTDRGAEVQRCRGAEENNYQLSIINYQLSIIKRDRSQRQIVMNVRVFVESGYSEVGVAIF